MMRAVIIDDEKRARNYLRGILEDQFKEVEIVGEADGVATGCQLIESESPDLLFLDVQMQDGTGFDLLSKIVRSKYQIIFVSAYDRFAITAIKFSAVDYLLKPVETADLSIALEKIKQSNTTDKVQMKLDLLLNNINKIEKIALPSLNGIEIIKLEDIIRCESDNNYTTFYLKSKERIIVSKTLKDYEDMLESKGFFRTHKSHIINLAYLKKYIKGEGGFAVMEDGSEITVSRRRKEEFMEVLANFI
ncbi:MAG: response regulator transcription factor [Bacteroidetes bacterium]|nr:response regulator transcription factor [Bacteroidota bacterium]